MDRNAFYQKLSEVKDYYSWEVMEDNSIVATRVRGKDRGNRFNPVTAVANRLGYSINGNNKRETLKVGSALGLPRDFIEQVYNATVSSSNRGFTQILRGKIRSALEI